MENSKEREEFFRKCNDPAFLEQERLLELKEAKIFQEYLEKQSLDEKEVRLSFIKTGSTSKFFLSKFFLFNIMKELMKVKD